MGNQCSCPWFQKCCPCWGQEKPLNLPSKTDVVERPKPVVPDATDNVGFLAIKGWNMEQKKNGEEHRTASYVHMHTDTKPASEGNGPTTTVTSEPPLIIRRGQTFYVTLETNIPYDSDKHKISIVASVSDCTPNFGNQTQIGILVGAEEPSNGWWAKVHSQTEKNISLEIRSSETAIVGEWNFDIDTDSEGKTCCFPCPQKVFLLFNPWCEGDGVYLEDEAEKQEFVLSDAGLIWRGTHTRLRPCPWQFGQFEKNVLESVLHVLNHLCKLLPAHRADPIKVVRAISAGVNSPDDSGVLVGNWTGKYEDGRPPTEWRDSSSILKEYYDKRKSVKYGQCWVFSGVVTTACRTLGIPCRSVTNYSSAHDTHNSLTIDFFFGENGESIEELNADSVWNFHVWNEVWMARPDLGPDFGGWQVIDATPQEQSDGQFRCGPASLEAVKRGLVHLPYDVPFVYAEINADKLFWKYRGKRQPMKLLGKKTGGIGINISTKSVGKMRRDDVTYLYKHAEGSEAERDVMREALKRCQNAFARYYLNEEMEDVKFDLHLRDDIVIGKTFVVSASVENKTDEDRDVRVILRADTMLYTGVIKENVKTLETNIVVKAKSEHNVEMPVSFEDYFPKLVDQCAFNISCLGKVTGSEFEYFAQDDFRVRKPDIEIKCLSEEEPRVGKPSKWEAKFQNPLPMGLTKARFYATPSNAESSFVKLKNRVEPNAFATAEFDVTPRKEGQMTVAVIFTSKELEDVDGFVTRDVGKVPEPAPEPEEEEEPPENKEEETEEKEVKPKPDDAVAS